MNKFLHRAATVAAFATLFLIAGCVREKAFAQGSISHTCSSGSGYSRCTTRFNPAPAREFRTDEEVREAIERDARWEAYCKPVGAVDRYGMTRLSYAHEGCEFGRDSDAPSSLSTGNDRRWPTAAEQVAKAVADQKRCAPVRVSGDTSFTHTAMGCR